VDLPGHEGFDCAGFLSLMPGKEIERVDAGIVL